ncbi:MAG: hypothetical protein WCE68_05010 [Anaerolineales bacterium]
MKKLVIAAIMVVTMALLTSCGIRSGISRLFSKPTPTVAPTPALPQPTVAPSGTVLFQDNFTDPTSGWGSGTNANGSIGYANNGYTIQVSVPKFERSSHPSKTIQNDVRLQVDASKLAGPDKNKAGLICRFQNRNNYYGGVIGNDGSAAIFTLIAGQLSNIVKQQTTGVINPGTATNTIRFDCVGKTLTLYANGKVVATATDSTYASGGIGLVVGTYDTGGVSILFKNFSVTAP